MKGGKDEDKVTGPLFPRLHVNDTEKGGPRAPPRNKMALYEQFSVPSPRFNSATLPLPPNNTSNFVSSVSYSQGGGNERNTFSPFYIPSSTPTHSTEKLHARSSDGMNFNGAMEFDRKSIKNGSYKMSNVSGNLLSNAERNSNSPHDFSNSKNSSGKKSVEDDFRVPTYHHGVDRERLNPFPMCPSRPTATMENSPQKSITTNCNSSFQLQNTGDKSLKRTNITDLKSRIQGRNPSEQSPKETVEIEQSTVKATFHPSVVEKITEASKLADGFSIDKRPSSSTNERENPQTGNSRLCQETSVRLLSENNIGADGILVEPRCLNGKGITEKENASRVRSESGSRASLGSSHRRPNDAENCNEESEVKAQLGNVGRNNDESETAMVDSISGLNVSPDDVVGIIGQKHFWKARKEIVNQQRVFAVQVFELHRLIKVQKLIAGSPDLLLENNSYLSRPSPKVPAEKQTSDYSLQSQPQIIMQKDDSRKPSQNTECPSLKDDSQKPYLPPPVDDVDRGHASQNLNYGPYSGNFPPAPPAADNNPSPWCFPPPGNQWLVPIMSPSEGLVYKPYMGPCPPNVGFMTPAYGGCGPLSVPPTPAYGVPASHQQPGVGVFSGAPMVAQNYYSPHGLPVMNPMMSTPAVEQGNPSAGAQPHQQPKQVSTGEVNFNMHSGSSCNMSNQKSEAFSCCVRKFQAPKDSEIQGSTASSPSERAQGAGHVAEGREGRDALPLFPLDPTMEGSDLTPRIQSGDQQARVIKVVPHNPRSATESAARIFLSIQKERQQYDSL